MKKTLIALMALAGVAFGATTIDAKWDTAPVTAGNFYSDGWTFTFTLDESFTIEESGYVLAGWWGKNNSHGASDNAIYLTQVDGVLTLNVGRGRLSNSALDKTTTFTTFTDSAVDYVYCTGIETGVTYTLTATLTKANDNKDGMLTITDNMGGTWMNEGGAVGGTYKGNMAEGNENTTMTYKVNTGVVIPEPVTPSVPEPATATLSLLALAGLASRRRRK